jgi:hypothetical protein
MVLCLEVTDDDARTIVKDLIEAFDIDVNAQ